MYFIGVTTRQSSINAVFPRWAARLGLGDCELRGWDFPLHEARDRYRAAIAFIKSDPYSLGALVTTHKVGLYQGCLDLFDVIDPLTASLGEVGSIFKRHGRLHARAVDPWTVGDALAAILPHEHWRNGGEALILGAGGAGTALTWHLAKPEHGPNRPARVHVIDCDLGRLRHLRQLHATWAGAIPVECHGAHDHSVADAVVSRLPAGSLVVNATGRGKDTPGSPLSDAAIFPREGWAWEFNYRGNLVFLDQARAQIESRRLHVVDGWGYFLHGWTRVTADVFDREIPTHGPLFEELGQIAAQSR